ncbi:unnamed protein product, partial [Staurois parvus]
MWLQQHLYTEHLPAAPALNFRGGRSAPPPSPVIGRLCAFPELQFWRPITGEEAEPSSPHEHPVA